MEMMEQRKMQDSRTVSRMWSTTLNDSTFDPGRFPGLYAPGWASVVGEYYLTTDMHERLYCIRTSDGNIVWSYNNWPNISLSHALDRQITGVGDTIAVLRHGTIELLDIHNGTFKGRVHLSEAQKSGASFYALGSKLFLSYDSGFTVFDASGMEVWNTTVSAAQSSIQTGGSNGQGYIAYIQMWSSPNRSEEYPVLVISNVSGPGAIAFFELIHKSDDYVYINQVTNKSVMYFTIPNFGRSRVVRFDWACQRLIFDITIDDVVKGYGLGGDSFYFHFVNSMSAYDINTGALNGNTGQLTGVSFISHILGFPGFCVLGLATPQGTLNVTAWNATTLQQMWTMSPPSTPSYTVFSNWGGVLAIPSSAGGLTLVNGSDGSMMLQARSGQYTNFDPQSMVIGVSHLFFSFAATVVGLVF